MVSSIRVGASRRLWSVLALAAAFSLLFVSAGLATT